MTFWKNTIMKVTFLVIKLCILLSTFYTFFKGGLEYSCVLKKEGSITDTNNINDTIAGISVIINKGEKSRENLILNSNNMEIIYNRRAKWVYFHKNAEKYYHVDCNLLYELKGQNFSGLDLSFEEGRLDVEFYGNYPAEWYPMNNCFFTVYELDCKLGSKFVNGVYLSFFCFLNVAVVLFLMTEAGLLMALSIKIEKPWFDNLINMMLIILQVFDINVSAQAKFCYNKTGLIYKSSSRNKILTLKKNVSNISTYPSYHVYKQHDDNYSIIDNELFKNGELVQIQRNKKMEVISELCRLFWLNEFFGYPAVILGHCLSIEELLFYLEDGERLNLEDGDGQEFKGLTEQFIKSIHIKKYGQNLYDKLELHNRLFFEKNSKSDGLEELNTVLSAKVRFYNKPISCNNSSWKMYCSDVKRILEDHNIIIFGCDLRSPTDCYKQVTKEFSTISSKPDLRTHNIETKGNYNIEITKNLDTNSLNLKCRDEIAKNKPKIYLTMKMNTEKWEIEDVADSKREEEEDIEEIKDAEVGNSLPIKEIMKEIGFNKLEQKTCQNYHNSLLKIPEVKEALSKNVIKERNYNVRVGQKTVCLNLIEFEFIGSKIMEMINCQPHTNKTLKKSVAEFFSDKLEKITNLFIKHFQFTPLKDHLKTFLETPAVDIKRMAVYMKQVSEKDLSTYRDPIIIHPVRNKLIDDFKIHKNVFNFINKLFTIKQDKLMEKYFELLGNDIESNLKKSKEKNVIDDYFNFDKLTILIPGILISDIIFDVKPKSFRGAYETVSRKNFDPKLVKKLANKDLTDDGDKKKRKVILLPKSGRKNIISYNQNKLGSDPAFAILLLLVNCCLGIKSGSNKLKDIYEINNEDPIISKKLKGIHFNSGVRKRVYKFYSNKMKCIKKSGIKSTTMKPNPPLKQEMEEGKGKEKEETNTINVPEEIQKRILQYKKEIKIQITVTVICTYLFDLNDIANDILNDGGVIKNLVYKLLNN